MATSDQDPANYLNWNIAKKGEDGKELLLS